MSPQSHIDARHSAHPSTYRAVHPPPFAYSRQGRSQPSPLPDIQPSVKSAQVRSSRQATRHEYKGKQPNPVHAAWSSSMIVPRTRAPATAGARWLPPRPSRRWLMAPLPASGQRRIHSRQGRGSFGKWPVRVAHPCGSFVCLRRPLNARLRRPLNARLRLTAPPPSPPSRRSAAASRP